MISPHSIASFSSTNSTISTSSRLRLRLRLGSLAILAALALAAPACGDDDDGATPIADARGGASGSQVTIAGYVTVPPGAFVSAMEDQGFALQDDTAGVYIKMDDKQAFGLGAHVRVTGTLDEQNQLRIVKAVPADVEALSDTKQVTAKEVGTGAVKEPVEGQLIRVHGGITQTFMDDSPYGYKLYINDGSGEVQVFVHVSAGFDKAMLQGLTAGRQLTVIGFASQYETTYEVAPRQPSDLTAT